MKYAMAFLLMNCFWLFSCSNSAKEKAEHLQDSIETVELDQVDRMKIKDDSMIKAKEKELLEKYR